MIEMVLLTSVLLAGQVAPPAQVKKGEKAAPRIAQRSTRPRLWRNTTS